MSFVLGPVMSDLEEGARKAVEGEDGEVLFLDKGITKGESTEGEDCEEGGVERAGGDDVVTILLDVMGGGCDDGLLCCCC